MKTRNKVLLLALVAILLVVTTVFATLAYLTSETAEITNTFTVGNVSITMDETDLNEDGEDAGSRSPNGNTYKLISGKTYIKDPTIHVGNKSEDSYLFVKVKNGLGNNVTLNGGVLASAFEPVQGYTDLYVYGTMDSPTMINASTGDIVLFETFTVDSTLGNDQLSELNGKEIVLQAFAIQNEQVTPEAALQEAVDTLDPTVKS